MKEVFKKIQNIVETKEAKEVKKAVDFRSKGMAIEFDNDEHALFEVRKHWIILAREAIFVAIAVFAPIILMALLNSLPVKFATDPGNITSFLLFAYSLWLLIIWTVAFVFWTNYYLDIWMVTNKRLVYIEQHGLFRREISTMQLSRIQDVTSEQYGIIQTYFNFGNLQVQTAADEREFSINSVKNPGELRKKLSDALKDYIDIYGV